MDEELNTPQESEMSPADMLTGSGFAVGNDGVRWYIAECKPTKEGTIRTMLKNAKYEVFVASRTEEKIYANRTHHTKETILIPGKVFVHTTEKNLMPIMLGYSSVWRFMMNRLSKERSYAFVPENEMRQMQYVLGRANNPVLITAESLKVDQKVKVMRGALEGLEGWFMKQGHTSYVVIKVTMGTNHYVYTEVPLEDIQPL
jgi:transcription antitermination factor NusG